MNIAKVLGKWISGTFLVAFTFIPLAQATPRSSASGFNGADPSSASQSHAAQANAMPSGRASALHPQTSKIDINTATVDQLKAIPGVGDVYAKKIVAGRPYTTKHQLVTRGILPRGVYENIKEQIIAHHVKK